MSGVVAIFQRTGRPVDGDSIWAMLAAAPYRGADGMFLRVSESVGLGHAKMAVTHEEVGEQQPLVSPRTQCMVVADVRLDNRADLLAQLPDKPAATISDAELILRAYETWGVDVPARLLGDFAFILWDPRLQRLVCARDTSGQRSLYYRIDKETFAVASEIPQLLHDRAVLIAPDEAMIREFLVPVVLNEAQRDRPETFFAGIHAIPAGHVLVVDPEQAQVRQYWDLGVPREIHYRTTEQYAEHFLAIFSEAVRARLRTVGPIGALLSGGLDSSSVVCTAQELYRGGRAANRGFLGLSLVFDGLECDERGFIEDMQAKYGFEQQYLPATSSTDRLQLQPREFQESPFASILRICNPAFEAAAQAGVRAILTGDVADACVAGSPVVLDSVLRQGNLREFRQRMSPYLQGSGNTLRTLYVMRTFLIMNVGLPLLPLPIVRRASVAYLQRVFRRDWDHVVPHWMADALKEPLTQRDLDLRVERERRRRFASPSRHEEYEQLYRPEFAPHPAPWPLEIWRPFADRRLHEFLLAIPPEHKFAPPSGPAGGYAASKQVLRGAMRGILPERVRTRANKTFFDSVFRQELNEHWSKYASAFGPSGQAEIVDRGYVDQSRFWRRLEAVRDGSVGGDLMPLMRVVALETWLRSVTGARRRFADASKSLDGASVGIAHG
jgi:asparagine synthase (glutamine-hydrolysing)